MNIDITKWPVVTEIKEAGQYFVKHDGGINWHLDFMVVGEELRKLTTFRGPVLFGPSDPHLDLSSLDLSQYPVVDKPDRPGLWVLTLKNGSEVPCAISQSLLDSDYDFSLTNRKWQRIGDFTPPAPALPPVNSTIEVHCVKHLGREYWCTEFAGRYYSLDGVGSFGPNGCEVIGRKTVSLYDSSSAVATRTLAAKEVV